MNKDEKAYREMIQNHKQMMFIIMEKKRHPTQYLCDLIQAFYGHKVELKKLIQLIETSELPKEVEK